MKYHFLGSLKSTANKKMTVVSHLCYQENKTQFRLDPYCGFTKTGSLAIYPCDPPKSVNETYVFFSGNGLPVTHRRRQWAVWLPASICRPRSSQMTDSIGGHGLQGPSAHLPCRRTSRKDEEERGEWKKRADDNVKHVEAKRD